MTRPILIPLALAALMMLSQPARAQQADSGSQFGFRPYAPFLGQTVPPPDSKPPTNLPHRRTYLVEGAVTGGLLFGLAGSALVGVACSYESDSSSCALPTVAGGLIGALAGSALGGLVGSLLHKPAR